MHCYSGTPEMSKKFIEMGYYLGVGVPVTRYKDVEETVRITSIDIIVIEIIKNIIEITPIAILIPFAILISVSIVSLLLVIFFT